jgi:hypothetical protein
MTGARPRYAIEAMLGLLLLGTPLLARGEAIPDPARGLYAIWPRPEISDSLTFLKGVQVRLHWSDVQPAAAIGPCTGSKWQRRSEAS